MGFTRPPVVGITNRGSERDKPQTGDKVMGAQGEQRTLCLVQSIKLYYVLGRLDTSKPSVLVFSMLYAGEMGRDIDMSGFDRSQNVMTRQLCQII